MPLRIVLMGTGEFALPPFRAVIESPHSVVGLFTQPDRSGRGHHRHVNSLKQLAVDKNIPVFQPERVNRPEHLVQLRSLQADVFLVAAYGQILKPDLLAIPRLGCFNLHGSLLPRHRGAAPVQYSVWCGDAQTGVTVFQIEPSLDSGPIVGRIETTIGPKETSGELMLRLAELSAPLTLKVLSGLERSTAVFESQNPDQVTLAPKIRKEQGEIDWNSSPHQIDCHVRAMQPWPRASTTLLREGHPPLRCLILVVKVSETTTAEHTLLENTPPGQIDVTTRKLLVRARDGVTEILRIQPEGSRPMTGTAFINGHVIVQSARFGKTA